MNGVQDLARGPEQVEDVCDGACAGRRGALANESRPPKAPHGTARSALIDEITEIMADERAGEHDVAASEAGGDELDTKRR